MKKPPAKIVRIQEDEVLTDTYESMGEAILQGIEDRFAYIASGNENKPSTRTKDERDTRRPNIPTCFCCGRPGHIVRDCQSNPDQDYVYTEDQKRWLRRVQDDPKTAGPPPTPSNKTPKYHKMRNLEYESTSSPGTETDENNVDLN